MANTNILTDISIGNLNSNFNNNTSYSGVRLHRSVADVHTRVREWEKKQSTNESLKFPSDSHKYSFIMTTSEYSRKTNNPLMKVNFKKIYTIYLPLPSQGIVDSHEVDYSEEELGAAGSIASAGTNIMNDIGNSGGYIGGLLATLGLQGGGAADQLLGTGATGTIQALTGLSPNKFMTILLKGPRYKRHEFTWKLYPRNFHESDQINKIISKINESMAVGLHSSGLLYEFPHIFYFQYSPNPKFLYKFKPCVLESFSVNYAPGGSPSFYRGPNDADHPPECVEMRARFIEIEYWLRNQFKNSSEINDASIDGPHRNITGYSDQTKKAIADSYTQSNENDVSAGQGNINGGTGSAFDSFTGDD